MAARGNKNKGEKEKAVERKYEAFELRKTGLSYRAIGASLDLSCGQAYQDVMWVLKTIIDDHKEEVEIMRQMEVERLDAYIESLDWKKNKGDFRTIELLLKIQDRRAKLLGLDMPFKIAPTDPSGNFSLIELIKRANETNGGK